MNAYFVKNKIKQQQKQNNGFSISISKGKTLSEREDWTGMDLEM